MTLADVARAVYFDFECTGGGGNAAEPAILGWCWKSDAGNPQAPLAARCVIVRETLWPSARIKVPQSRGLVRCEALSLDHALQELGSIAQQDGRLISSWSQADLRTIQSFADPAIAGSLGKVWVNAKDVAKRWYRASNAPFPLPPQPGQFTLAAFLAYFNASHPRKYGYGVAAHGIQTMEQALARHGTFAQVTTAARLAWRAALGHNYLDCRGAYFIANVCVARLATMGA